MLEKIKVFKNIANWFLNLDTNKKFVLFLILIIASLAYINYANRRDFRQIMQVQTDRYNDCVTRRDSLIAHYSKIQIQLEKEKAIEKAELIKRYETKIEELYLRTDKIYSEIQKRRR